MVVASLPRVCYPPHHSLTQIMLASYTRKRLAVSPQWLKRVCLQMTSSEHAARCRDSLSYGTNNHGSFFCLSGSPDILICGNCREMFTDLVDMLDHKRDYCKLRWHRITYLAFEKNCQILRAIRRVFKGIDSFWWTEPRSLYIWGQRCAWLTWAFFGIWVMKWHS